METHESSKCHHESHSNEHKGNRKYKGLASLLFSLIGLLSLLWMLIRIIPKPSRAQYPCMKVAAPLASGFVAYVAGMMIAVFSFKKAKHYFRNSRYVMASALVFAALAAGAFTLLRTDNVSLARTTVDSLFVPTDPPNSPMGTAKGINPVAWSGCAIQPRQHGTARQAIGGMTGTRIRQMSTQCFPARFDH